jgi:hypothetical protein
MPFRSSPWRTLLKTKILTIHPIVFGSKFAWDAFGTLKILKDQGICLTRGFLCVARSKLDPTRLLMPQK